MNDLKSLKNKTNLKALIEYYENRHQMIHKPLKKDM